MPGDGHEPVCAINTSGTRLELHDCGVIRRPRVLSEITQECGLNCQRKQALVVRLCSRAGWQLRQVQLAILQHRGQDPKWVPLACGLGLVFGTANIAYVPQVFSGSKSAHVQVERCAGRASKG